MVELRWWLIVPNVTPIKYTPTIDLNIVAVVDFTKIIIIGITRTQILFIKNIFNF